MKKLLLILLCFPMIVFGQNVNIPDVNFKALLVANPNINTNGDNEIQISEATNHSGAISLGPPPQFIYDLTGIEAFINLTALWCNNSLITSLDVSQNIALNMLNCNNNNQLTSLNVNGATALLSLSCSYNNQLTSLDVSQNTALGELNCSDNQLTSLDVSQNTALGELNCSDNQLTSLDVSQNTALYSLNCSNNQLTSLDVSQNTALEILNCSDNQLTILDVSQNTALSSLNCSDNQLINLNVKNGNNYSFWNSDFPNTFYCTNNPLLGCIEVDDAAYSTANWTYIDSQHYFSTNCSGTSLQEHAIYKELLKVKAILGRETKELKNQTLLYIYNDGTVEKRITID